MKKKNIVDMEDHFLKKQEKNKKKPKRKSAKRTKLEDHLSKRGAD